MKSMITALALSLFLITPAFAQQGAQKQMHPRERLSPQKRADLQTRTMDQHLHLSTDQRHRLQKINLESARELEPVLEERRQQNNHIQQLEERRMREYRKVLSPEQMNDYNKLRKTPSSRK